MIRAERAKLEQMQSALQSTVIYCRVAVRKVGHTHFYTMVPHHVTYTLFWQHIHYAWTHAHVVSGVSC